MHARMYNMTRQLIHSIIFSFLMSNFFLYTTTSSFKNYHDYFFILFYFLNLFSTVNNCIRQFMPLFSFVHAISYFINFVLFWDRILKLCRNFNLRSRRAGLCKSLHLYIFFFCLGHQFWSVLKEQHTYIGSLII